MSEIQPPHRPEARGHLKKSVATRRIPQEVVPVPLGEVRDLVRAAIQTSSLGSWFGQVLAGWAWFEPRLRFTAVDESHSLIEFDVTGWAPGVDVLMHSQGRGEIDRFFVAIHDELDRRATSTPPPRDPRPRDLPSY